MDIEDTMTVNLQAQVIIRPEEIVTLADGETKQRFLLETVDKVISRKIWTPETTVEKIGFAEAQAPQEQFYTLTQAFSLAQPVELVFLGVECDGDYVEASFDRGTTAHLRDDKETENPILIIQIAPGMTTDEIALRAPQDATVRILYQRI
jgi:hypothetical protein